MIYTTEQIDKRVADIDRMTHEEMARMWRFQPAGHVYFRNDLPFLAHFLQRFQRLGGMTVTMSRRIGWK